MPGIKIIPFHKAHKYASYIKFPDGTAPYSRKIIIVHIILFYCDIKSHELSPLIINHHETDRLVADWLSYLILSRCVHHSYRQTFLLLHT